MDDVVIVAAQRTAVGKFGGSLSKIAASDLGAQVIKALLAKTGIKPESISEVILGQGVDCRCRSKPCAPGSDPFRFA